MAAADLVEAERFLTDAITFCICLITLSEIIDIEKPDIILPMVPKLKYFA